MCCCVSLSDSFYLSFTIVSSTTGMVHLKKKVNVGFMVDTVTLDRFLSQYFSFPLQVPVCQCSVIHNRSHPVLHEAFDGALTIITLNNKNNTVSLTASYGQVYEVVLRHRVNFAITCDITALHLGLQSSSQCSALLLTRILYWVRNPHPVASPPHRTWAWFHCYLVCSR
jgi:hypothetical protein